MWLLIYEKIVKLLKNGLVLYDDGVLWDDPDINVKWPLELVGGKENVILAEKDKNLQSFVEFMNKYGGF